MQAAAKLMTPPNFNQNLMIETSTTGKFSYFPTLPEEGAVKFTDTEDSQSDIEAEDRKI